MAAVYVPATHQARRPVVRRQEVLAAEIELLARGWDPQARKPLGEPGRKRGIVLEDQKPLDAVCQRLFGHTLMRPSAAPRPRRATPPLRHGLTLAVHGLEHLDRLPGPRDREPGLESRQPIGTAHKGYDDGPVELRHQSSMPAA